MTQPCLPGCDAHPSGRVDDNVPLLRPKRLGQQIELVPGFPQQTDAMRVGPGIASMLGMAGIRGGTPCRYQKKAGGVETVCGYGHVECPLNLARRN